MVVKGRIELGRNADGGSGCIKYGGGGGYGQDGTGDTLNRWEYTVANGTDTNAPLAYDMVL